MSTPNPYSQLEGHCAAVNDDTLYVLSPDGFQSLPLKKKAQWSKETNGVAVSGPACVKVGDGNDAALFVIGGKTDNHSFTGLQKYTFSSKKWETLTSASDDVIKQRTDHSVAYLPDSRSILVYAGSQPNAPSQLSSQTFTISTEPPYNIDSYVSKAPPTNLPILLTWTNESAIMLGGAQDNTQIYTFNPQDGWERYKTNLAEAPSGVSRGMIVDVDGGGKVLELYDFSVSPNTVSSIVLEEMNGRPARTGQTVGNGTASGKSSGKSSSKSSSHNRNRKRQLSLRNWPQYQSKNAPKATRTDCSLSQDSNGLAVIAGGSADEPLALFNQEDNSWVDADQFFDSKHIQHPLKPSHTPSSTPTSTSSSSPTSTSSGSGGTSSHTLRLLGIILGVLFGIAAVFILILLYLRYRKQKQRRLQGDPDEKRMSFQDRGASFMKEAGGSANELGYYPGEGANKHSSLAMMFGSKRNTINHVAQKSSFDSTANLVRDKDGEMFEPVEMVNIGESDERKPSEPTSRYGNTLTVDDSDAKARRKRSSGWSKYFATSGPTGPNGLSHLPDAYHKSVYLGGDGAAAAANPASSDQAAAAPKSSMATNRTSSSNLLPPLDLAVPQSTLDGQRLSHVATGSPSISDSAEDTSGILRPAEAQSGLIVDARDSQSRPRSATDTISSMRSTNASTITSEYYHDGGLSLWTPNLTTMGTGTAGTTPATATSANFKDHIVGAGRRSSSMYSTPTEPRVTSRGRSAGFFPGAGTSYRPARRPRAPGPSEVDVDEWPAPPRSSVSTVGGPGNAASMLSTGAPAAGVATVPNAAQPGGGPGVGVLNGVVPTTLASVKEQLRDSQFSVAGARTSQTAVPGGYAYAGAPAGAKKDTTTPAAPGGVVRPMNEDLTWLDLGQGGRS